MKDINCLTSIILLQRKLLFFPFSLAEFFVLFLLLLSCRIFPVCSWCFADVVCLLNEERESIFSVAKAISFSKQQNSNSPTKLFTNFVELQTGCWRGVTLLAKLKMIIFLRFLRLVFLLYSFNIAKLLFFRLYQVGYSLL